LKALSEFIGASTPIFDHIAEMLRDFVPKASIEQKLILANIVNSPLKLEELAAKV